MISALRAGADAGGDEPERAERQRRRPLAAAARLDAAARRAEPGRYPRPIRRQRAGGGHEPLREGARPPAYGGAAARRRGDRGAEVARQRRRAGRRGDPAGAPRTGPALASLFDEEDLAVLRE